MYFNTQKQWKEEKRCRLCLMNIQGEDQKLKKEKFKKVTTQCQKCAEAVCNEHSIQTCLCCGKKWFIEGTMEFLLLHYSQHVYHYFT